MAERWCTTSSSYVPFRTGFPALGRAVPPVLRLSGGGDAGGRRPGRRRFVRGAVAMDPVSCNESLYVAAPSEGCTVGISAG